MSWTLYGGEVGVPREHVVECELGEVLEAHGGEDALAGVPATNPIRKAGGGGTRSCEGFGMMRDSGWGFWG